MNAEPTEMAGAAEAETGSIYAWALDDDADEFSTQRLTSRRITTLALAASLVVIAVAGAVSLFVLHNANRPETSPSRTVAETTPTPPPPVTVTAPPPVTVTASAPAHDPAREKSFLAALDTAAALSGPNHVSYATIPGSHGAYMGDVSAWMPGGSVLKYAYQACAVLARYPHHYEQATDPFYEEVGMPMDVDAKTQQERVTYMQIVGFDLC